MEEIKEIDLTEEYRNENDEVLNVTDSIEKEKLHNGSGDNGERQPLKLKSKVGKRCFIPNYHKIFFF